MKIKLTNPSEDLKAFISLTELIQKEETKDKAFLMIDEKLNTVINDMLINILPQGKYIPLSDEVIDKIPEDHWYAFIFHYVFTTLNQNNGSLNYILINAIESYVVENKIEAGVELSITDISNIIYESNFDVAIVSLAIDDIVKKVMASQTKKENPKIEILSSKK